MPNESMVFYSSFSKAIKRLPEDEQLKALWSIIDYGIDGKEPEGDGVSKAVFYLAKPKIDRSIRLLDSKNGRHCAEYSEWRKKVFERDNYTCQICGKRGVELNAHHIKYFSKYPELRYDIKNGITLCKNCHKEVHKRERKFCDLC